MNKEFWVLIFIFIIGVIAPLYGGFYLIFTITKLLWWHIPTIIMLAIIWVTSVVVLERIKLIGEKNENWCI